MAKKKTSLDNNGDVLELDLDIEETREDILKRVIKDIEKTLGKNVIIDGNEILERPKMIIPFSPSINQITGGGIPEGSWVILSGPPKIGKSVHALHFAKNCQKPENGSRNIYYLNVEARLKQRDILGIEGLKPDKFHIIESTENRVLSTEDYLNAASNILNIDKGCVIIIDSLSQLSSQRQQEGGVGVQTRGAGGILVGDFTSQMAPIVNVKKAIVISILQHRNNTGDKGAKYFEKGGWAVQFQADIKLISFGAPKPFVEKEGANPVGQIITWKCTSTGTGCPPNRECQSYIRYGEGIDETTELIVDASDIGLIDGGGTAWLKFDFLKTRLKELGLPDDTVWDKEKLKEIGGLANGVNAARRILKDNPIWMKWLEDDLRAAL